MHPLKLTILSASISLLALNTCHADDNTTYFNDKNGKLLDASTALLAALRKETVFKCSLVEAKTSKSGTSISLRNVKKAKVTE